MTEKTSNQAACIPSPAELDSMTTQLSVAEQLCPILSRPGIDTALMPAVASPENQPDVLAPVEIYTEWQRASDRARRYLRKVNLPENTANQVMHLALKEINSNPAKIAGRSPAIAVLEILHKEVTDLGYAA